LAALFLKQFGPLAGIAKRKRNNSENDMKAYLALDEPSPMESPVKHISCTQSCSSRVAALKWLATATALLAAWFIYRLITVLLSLDYTLEQVRQSVGQPMWP